MVNKNEIIYPSFQRSNFRLEYAFDEIEINKINLEISRDFKTISQLSTIYFSPTLKINDTWAEEKFIIQIFDKVNLSWINVGYISASWSRVYSIIDCISLCILPQYQNKGFALKASVFLFQYLFEYMKLEKLETSCFEFNLESYKIQNKFLTQEGIRRNSLYFYGKRWNRYLFGLTKEEYFELKEKHKLLFEKLLT